MGDNGAKARTLLRRVSGERAELTARGHCIPESSTSLPDRPAIDRAAAVRGRRNVDNKLVALAAAEFQDVAWPLYPPASTPQLVALEETGREPTMRMATSVGMPTASFMPAWKALNGG